MDSSVLLSRAADEQQSTSRAINWEFQASFCAVLEAAAGSCLSNGDKTGAA